MDDLVSRQTALDMLQLIIKMKQEAMDSIDSLVYFPSSAVERFIEKLPSVQPEVKPIDYQDCSNAMLKMWMDNVVTDGEYNRIMDKLNAHWRKKDE